MLLAHELVRGAILEGDTLLPDAVVDLSDVVEAVRAQRARTPHAPGEGLPTPQRAFLPWETAVFEHPVEGAAARRRNLYASQRRLDAGGYRLEFTVVDVGLTGEELEVAYYGACSVLLDAAGAMVRFERDMQPDQHEVLVEDGQLLEMVFPVLVANHLWNMGVLGEEEIEVMRTDELALSGAFGAAAQA